MQSFPNSLVTPDGVVPVVGMGATTCVWSDRHPAQVVRVSDSGKTCWIKSVSHKIISGSARDGSAKYEYGTEVNANEPEQRVNKTASGGWKRQGGNNVWLGRCEYYCDPHF
jgi:hypothetical protein